MSRLFSETYVIFSGAKEIMPCFYLFSFSFVDKIHLFSWL